jgi:hypothetical protein
VLATLKRLRWCPAIVRVIANVMLRITQGPLPLRATTLPAIGRYRVPWWAARSSPLKTAQPKMPAKTVR